MQFLHNSLPGFFLHFRGAAKYPQVFPAWSRYHCPGIVFCFVNHPVIGLERPEKLYFQLGIIRSFHREGFACYGFNFSIDTSFTAGIEHSYIPLICRSIICGYAKAVLLKRHRVRSDLIPFPSIFLQINRIGYWWEILTHN